MIALNRGFDTSRPAAGAALSKKTGLAARESGEVEETMLPTIHTKRRSIRRLFVFGAAGAVSLVGCILPVARVNVESGGRGARPQRAVSWERFDLVRKQARYFESAHGVGSPYSFDLCLEQVPDALREARPDARLVDAESLWQAVFPNSFRVSAQGAVRYERTCEAIEALGVQYLVVVGASATSDERKGGVIGGRMAGGYYGAVTQRESVFASAALLEAAPDGQRESFFAHSDARERVAAVAFVPFLFWAPSLANKACRALGDEVPAALPQEYRGESLGVAVVAGRYAATWDAPSEPRVLEGDLAEQYRLFKEAEREGTIQAYERFLEVDTYGGFLEVEAQRRIEELRGTSPPQTPLE